jgi:hypothetical protein
MNNRQELLLNLLELLVVELNLLALQVPLNRLLVVSLPLTLLVVEMRLEGPLMTV